MMRRGVFWLVNFMPIYMPALSPSMETGKVVEWKKKIGDMVKENDVFCSIETDKAVVEYTNTFEPGYLAKIYCSNGQSAEVAKTIAVMVDDAADVAKADEYVIEGEEQQPAAAAAAQPAAEAAPPAAAAAPAAAATPAAAPAAAAAGTTTSTPPEDVTVMPIYMPALSPSMETGKVVEWKKKIGDMVKENDVFCSIETDKAVVEYTNTFEPGYLAKIYCSNGESATVAKTIAVMVSEPGDIPKVENYYPEDAAGAPAAAAAPPAAAAAAAAPSTPAPAAAPAAALEKKLYGGSVAAAVEASGPSVIRIAKGLSAEVLASITPSGKDGRFMKGDFAGQPGFDYNDAAPAAAMAGAGKSSSSGAGAGAAPAKAAKASVATPSGVYGVVIKPGPVLKSVDDTAVLRRLLATMEIGRKISK